MQYSNIYPGPDGKLYIGPWHGLCGQMSVINNPDSKGAACGFCPKCLRFPGYIDQGMTVFSGVTTPPCMPNYQLGPASPICYPTGIERTATQELNFSLYPNPARGTIVVKCGEPGELSLYDMAGRSVGSFTLKSTNYNTSI